MSSSVDRRAQRLESQLAKRRVLRLRYDPISPSGKRDARAARLLQERGLVKVWIQSPHSAHSQLVIERRDKPLAAL